MGATKPTSKIEANAIALVALNSYTGRKADKSALAEGSEFTGIKLDVSGKVGRRKVNFAVAGQLTVGQGSPTGGTKKPTANDLLAYCVSRLPAAELKKIQKHAEAGKLPAPSDDDLATAKTIIKSLSYKVPRRGAVSFVEG